MMGQYFEVLERGPSEILPGEGVWFRLRLAPDTRPVTDRVGHLVDVFLGERGQVAMRLEHGVLTWIPLDALRRMAMQVPEIAPEVAAVLRDPDDAGVRGEG